MAKLQSSFCMADDFCKFFDALMEEYMLKPDKSGVITVIRPCQHDSGYRYLKHLYLEKVCEYLHHILPKIVSYNRFVELEKEVVMPLALFIKKALLGKCTGISFVDCTPLRVYRNQNTCP